MYMSSTPTLALKRAGNDRGIAMASEYVLLLGVSMLIFTAIYIGFGSFGNTASGDARSAAAYRVAVHVSERMSGAVLGGASVTESIDVPGRICGSPYMIYPSRDGKAICVLMDGDGQEAPVLAPDGVKVEGFMMSLPEGHRIDYNASAKTLTMA
jgi:hypothetical protein